MGNSRPAYRLDLVVAAVFLQRINVDRYAFMTNNFERKKKTVIKGVNKNGEIVKMSSLKTPRNDMFSGRNYNQGNGRIISKALNPIIIYKSALPKGKTNGAIS